MDIRHLINTLEDITTDNEPQVGDNIEIELGDTLLETYITEVTEDGVVIHVDESALKMLINVKKQINEGLKDPKDNPCWKGYHPVGTKKKNGRTVPNCVPKESVEEDGEDSEYDDDDPKHPDYAERRAERNDNERDRKRDSVIDEAEYQGREVPLGKPMAGDVKKSKVYVKGPKGNVVKVNFGDKNMRIKKSNPGRRKNFRARHNCDNPGPRWKARYWSCRAW